PVPQPAHGFRALGKSPQDLQRLQSQGRWASRGWRGGYGAWSGGGMGAEGYRSLGRSNPQSSFGGAPGGAPGRRPWDGPGGQGGGQGGGGQRNSGQRRRSRRRGRSQDRGEES
ncbi:MAG TPA: hypothetical protein VHS99_18210, partial [Chloroflexota bacterium]|nr:hypothetical protein [Chloroflexota bacterium]